MIEKECGKCHIIKPITEFYVEKKRKKRRNSYCKDCMKKYVSEWVKRNKEKKREQKKRWSENNKERIRERRNEWKRKNPERQRKNARECMRRMYNKNPCFRLARNTGKRVRKSLSYGKNGQSWERLLGFTCLQLKKHLEKQFTPEMSWENYGPVWHIDHIVPISAFNFTKPEDLDFKRCWSLKNLRPLLAEENWAKNNKLEKPFQPSLCF